MKSVQSTKRFFNNIMNGDIEMKPIIAVTMGDPSSIGAELSVKAMARKDIYENCKPLIVGDFSVMEEAKAILGMDDIRLNPIQDVKDAVFTHGTIDVYDMKLIKGSDIQFGEIKALYGDAAFQYVVKAIELAKTGEVDATVTNAISKESINLAGHHFAGHTEIYAHYTETKDYAMMLVHNNLRVVHVSTHVSLREACDRVKKERVLKCIELANEACRMIGIEEPTVAVAGLNPHAGENGMFGHEEIEEIIPAIEEAKSKNIKVEGPAPPDTVFPKALGGWYDVVVVMYHDQGHIPLKTVGFVYDKDLNKWKAVEGVNITLGLPIIRVSVDHGTAFDQAGKGTASEISLVNSIQYAIEFSRNKK